MASFWDQLFTSQQQREGQQDYSQYLKDIQAMQSPFAGVSNVSDVNKRFGITPLTATSVQGAYNPARATLATRLGQARSAAAARQRGSNATPGMTFGNIESSFAPTFGELESNAAQEALRLPMQSQQYGANLLSNVLGQQQQFGEWQTGARGKALQDYLSTLSPSSPFEDILGVAGSLAKLPTGKDTNALTDVGGLIGKGASGLFNLVF